MKINGLIFRCKPLEKKGKHTVFMLNINEETGVPDMKACQLTNQKKVYDDLEYYQINLVRWRMKKVGTNGNPNFEIEDLMRLNLKDKDNNDMPVYIAIKSNEFVSLWKDMWETVVKRYNQTH